MFKNATFLPFYFADNQLFINSETLDNNICLDELHIEIDERYIDQLFNLLSLNLM
jgi:hypothetical protein